MKEFMKKVRGEKVKVGGQGQQWWFAFLIAAATLVAPLASHASEFPGMGAAYAQRLEQYRKISSLWLAPQVLLSEAQEPPVPSLITQHSYFNTSLTPIPNWSARGAYCDWQPIDLPDTFRFPVGLEYLTRITILAYGEVRATVPHPLSEAQETPIPPLNTHHSYFNTSLASLPCRVSIEPGVSTVSHGLTPSNSYLIAWQNACVERSATNRVDAAIELFPNGSVVTTWQPHDPNQQPTTINQQPALPPGFPGHDQDADWIRATFPDEADEILAVGYANWLNDWVGVDAENGRYQAAITISEQEATNSQPPIYLVCGPYKVNVTEPGIYRFPLEVFERYEIRTYPEALPLTVTFDDGYTGTSPSYEIVDASSPSARRAGRSAPPDQPTNYNFYLKPLVVVTPNRIPRAQANGAHVSLWCNVANYTRRFCRTATREFYLNFCWPSDAEIIAADDDLEREIAAEEEREIEVVYDTPQGECSGWIVIDGHLPPPPEPPSREDAAVFDGPSWQQTFTNGCRTCELTVTTTAGSTDTHTESGTLRLRTGQSADIAVYFMTTEAVGAIYDDEVDWSVSVDGDVGMSGHASVSTASNGELLAARRYDPTDDRRLRIHLSGSARNAVDGLRQSAVRIVVTTIRNEPSRP